MLKRISISVLIALIMLLGMPIPALAASLESPTSFSIQQVEVYRNCLELNDQLYLVTYDISYTVNATPDNPIDDTYIFRLSDNTSTIVSTTTAYGYFNGGYDYGIASIYFSADDAPTWSANYTMAFEGNPALSWVAGSPPNTSTSSFTLWYDGGTVRATQDRLTTRLRYLAGVLETDWGSTVDLIEDTPTGKVLTTEGEEYFTNSIDNLRDICPDLFYQSMEAATFVDDILVLDFYASGNDDIVQVYGVNWVAQTFTTSSAYPITGIQIPIYRTGAPGTITASIRATAGSLPNGADLTSGTYAGNTVTTDTGGEWIDIAFNDDYDLTAATEYAIVIRATTGDANNRINWLVDTDGGYDDGQEATSVNSGVVWAAVAANDLLFELLVRGGDSLRYGHRYELSLLGTQFDVSQIASNWGFSYMWVSSLFWVAMTVVIIVAVSIATGSFNYLWIIFCMLSAYGWRAGFADTYLMVGSNVISSIGIVYAIWYKRTY